MKNLTNYIKITLTLILTMAVALLGGTECKKKEEVPKPELAKKAPVTPVKPALPEPGSIVFPKDIIVYGSIQNLNNLLKTAGDIVSKFNPAFGASVPIMISQGLQNEVLGTKDLNWLDTTKQFKVITLNPKTFNNPDCFIIPVKDKKAFEASLPDNKLTGTEGNEFQYTNAESTIYANFVNDSVVLTKDAKIFGLVKDFIEGNFASHQAKGIFDIQVSIKNIREIFAAEIQAYIKQITEAPSAPTPVPIPGMNEMLKKETELIFKLLDQSEIAQIEGFFDNGKIKLGGKLKVQENSVVDKLIASFKGLKFDSMELAPANNWLLFTGKIDPSLFSGWTKMGTDFLIDMLNFSVEEKSKFDGFTNQLISLGTGEFMYGFYSEGTFPLAFSLLSGVKDGKKVQTLAKEYYAFLFNKIMLFAKAQIKEKLPPINTESLQGLIDSIKPLLDGTGVNLSLGEETYKDTIIDLLNVSVDYNKLPTKDNPDVQKIKGVIGNKATIALAFAKDYIVLTFGTNALAEAKRLIDKKTIPAGAGLRGAGTTVQNPGIIGIVSIPKLLGAFASFDPEVKKLADKSASAPEDYLSFALGGYEHTLDINLSIPLDQIANIVGNSAK